MTTLLAAAILGAGALPATAQGRFEMTRDPEDGAFDISAWLATAGGFLPVVSPVTEPAVGYGASVALAFFHRPPDWDIDEARRRFEARERMEIPSISAGFGMYTESRSWAAGGGHLGVWGDGRWRYTGGLGLVGLNLQIALDLPTDEDVLVPYELSGWGLLQSLRYRLGATDLYLGGRYSLLQMKTRLPAEGIPGVDPQETESGIGSMGISATWDGRNNTFTTDRGLLAEVVARRADTAFGGDFDYWAADAKAIVWLDPIEQIVIGVRAEGGLATDGVPFWAKPGVSLRGVAGGRYSGDRTATFESEVRWDFTGRWSLVGFGGGGVNVTTRDATEDLVRWVGSGGAGFRYLLARAFGLRGGLDFAWGADGFAFYVTTGSAW